MKHHLHRFRAIMRVLLFVALFNPIFKSFAQTPAITVQSGIPVGTVSGTGVAYGNGIYLSIFSSGLIYTSTNGDDWTKVTDPSVPAGTFNRIVFGGGKFVIVGTNGLVFYSIDGIHWTTTTSGITSSLNDIQYINGNFYVVAPNNLLTSADGISWSIVTINGSTGADQFRNITYGNGLFVIASSRPGFADLYIYRSPTATSNSWTTQNLGYGFPNRVQYLKDRFYIFTSGTAVFTSLNGTSWTNSTASLNLTLPNMTTQNIGSPNQAFHGFYDGTKIYLFGYSKYWESYGSIFSSTDGVNFTLQSKTAYIVSQGAAWLNNKYFEYGNEGIVSSSDGINYKYPAGNFYGVASSGTGNYVGVGAVGSSGVVFSSPDFNNWDDHTPAQAPEINAVTWTGTKYIAAGNKAIFQSTDGSAWSQLATTGKTFTAIASDATATLVAGGYDAGTGVAELAHSLNGINWTVTSTANNWYFKIKNVNNGFFALGMDNDTYEGVVYYSSNGISWTNITPATGFTTYYYNDVVFDGSKYHLMGADAGYSFFSISSNNTTDVNSWSNQGTIVAPPGVTLGGYWGEGAFGYTSGHFAGSANDVATNEAYTLYSNDGIAWTAVPTGQLAYITGAVTEAGKVKMLGSGNLSIDVNFGLSTLPVTLTNFTASLVNETSLLKWQTATEWNSKNFVVEHSTDKNNWSVLGIVAAAGNSGTTQYYQFTHKAPVRGTNYYRLAQYDLDGSFENSTVAKVVVEEVNMKFTMHPNPATNNTTLQLPSASPSVVALYDIKGRQVYFKKHSGNNVQLSLQSLPKGYYQVVTEQDGHKYTGKLLHQ